MSVPVASPLPLGSGRWEEARLRKELRSIERGLRARLLSIEHDALSALRLYESLHGLPLFGNARAGAWYVPPCTSPHPDICAFKSADGHYGKWSSSLRRPNAHVFAAAVESGAVVIVDVTRSGKSWPDSLAKTVPIWCAVVNVVATLVHCTCPRAVSDDDDVCLVCVPLHVHPSVPASERSQILARLPHWVSTWRRSGAAMQQVVPSFAAARGRGLKPLRPLWVAPGRPLWTDGVPLDDLDFTPVICVSASIPVPQGERPLVEPRLEERDVCGVQFPVRSTAFSYVQGAGDDEEAWCQGLTPQLFWRYREEFLEIADGLGSTAGAVEIEARLKSRVEEVLSRTLPERNEPRTKTAIGVPIWKSRIRLARTPAMDLTRFAAAAGGQFGAVIILGSSRPAAEAVDGEEAIDINVESSNVTWVPLTDRKGKVEYKYAFGRALGPSLSLLRACCVDRGQDALVCCNGRSGDWAAGLAIAWLAWHCGAVSDPCAVGNARKDGDVVDRIEKMVYSVDGKRRDTVREISKEKIHDTMLHFTSTFPQFQISRATLKQLNRFFSSPTPSSTVSEL